MHRTSYPPSSSRASRPEAEIHPELLSARQVAVLLGISLRSVHRRRLTLPPAIVLSETCIRWRRTDLLAFVAQLPTGPVERREPPRLAAAHRKNRASGDDFRDRPVNEILGSQRTAVSAGSGWRNQESNSEFPTPVANPDGD